MFGFSPSIRRTAQNIVGTNYFRRILLPCKMKLLRCVQCFSKSAEYKFYGLRQTCKLGYRDCFCLRLLCGPKGKQFLNNFTKLCKQTPAKRHYLASLHTFTAGCQYSIVQALFLSHFCLGFHSNLDSWTFAFYPHLTKDDHKYSQFPLLTLPVWAV